MTHNDLKPADRRAMAQAENFKWADHFKVGSKFTHRRALHHVRGFVDDQMICRYWLAGLRRWEYVALGPVEFEFIA